MIIKGLVIILLLCEKSFQNSLSPPKLDTFHQVIPQIPESIVEAYNSVFPRKVTRIWENRLKSVKTPGLRTEILVPKTVLAPTDSRMYDLVVWKAPSPLYSPHFTQLTDDFFLNSISTQTIDFNDPQLTSPEGVTIKSMSGKDLLFRKDQQRDVFTVNGIDIKSHKQLRDGTNIIMIKNFLFNFLEEFREAFIELLINFENSLPQSSPPPLSLSETFEQQEPHTVSPSSKDTHRRHENSLTQSLDSEDHPLSGPETGLPEIPASFSSAFENNKLLNIWKYRLSRLQVSSGKIDSRVPVTILPVNFFKMVNLIPLDAPNPLYSDEYSELANNFILDSLSTDKIDLEDPNLTSLEGVVIKTFTGKDLVFKKDSQTGQLTVNGIDTESHKLLSDQKTVVVLKDFLFNYYEDIQTAFRGMAKVPIFLNRGKRSTHVEARSLSEAVQQTPTVEFNIPQVPLDLEAEKGDVSRANNLVFFWKLRLSTLERMPGFVRSATQPKTVLAVETFKMTNLIPVDGPHPLYSPEYTDLTDRFILESLSTEDINFDDPKLLTPEGLTIKTMNGKDLTFKKDGSTGKIQVNGIDVLSHTKLSGNTNLLVTSDFLFNINDDIRNASQQIYKPFKTSYHIFGFNAIPAVPKVLEGTENVGIDVSEFVNVWKNCSRIFSISIEAAEAPKTVVAVNFMKVTNLIPQDAPNPLYSESFMHVTSRFIRDSVSSQSIDINDPKLVSENGISIRAASGRYLVFKKDKKTNKLTINNIEVENNKTFEDGTSVFVISDFLFEHEGSIKSAFKRLQQRIQGYFS